MVRHADDREPTGRESATRLSLHAARVGFETARLRLAQIRQDGLDARVSAYRVACRQSAQTLGVHRVSIWMLAQDASGLAAELRCMLLYELAEDRYSSGDKLLRTQCPKYFEAIEHRRVLIVEDARSDPQTADIESYLKESRVGALLDAPIYRNGIVVGVVCHEQVGGVRRWTEQEAGFATAVADMLTILSHQADQAELRAAIDAQRQLEAQHHKMQALVKLSRVVIHDLGNVLTVASLRADMLTRESDMSLASEEIAQVLRYGTQLLAQLRDFCDARSPTALVDATTTLNAMHPVLTALVGSKDISLQFSCEQSAIQLDMAKVELEQLVLNLCMNAKDAIDGRGSIEVRATRADTHLEIIVKDDGRGMDEATQARLFEPFFTTKHGHSGIGLAAVYGIVERARGRIDVSSELGTGTTFTVQLPLRAPEGVTLDHPWTL